MSRIPRKNGMKVAVYTIAKNKVKQVEPFMGSCREADLVSIADTGSTDGITGLHLVAQAAK